MHSRIQVPLKADALLPANRQEREARLAFNTELTSYRQTAEWGMRAIQGSFGRLRVPLDIEDNQGRARLLEVCIHLNNLCANYIGISQIRSVYQPVWMRMRKCGLASRT